MADILMEFDDDASAAADVLRRRVETLRGLRCARCEARLCDHQALFSIALGFQDAARCLACLADAMGRSPTELRDHLFAHVKRRECYGTVWQEANVRESFPAESLPRCLWSGQGCESPTESVPTTAVSAHEGGSGSPTTAPDRIDAEWDAGDMGCGDLVLALRVRLNTLSPGAILKLIARDPGAPEDIPAWCRLTGHRLVEERHPEYLIQRKEP